MKKISCFIVILLSVFIISGCDNSNSVTKEKVVSNGKEVNTSEMRHKHCTRTASAATGIEVSLNYDLYFTDDILNLLKSEEKIVATKDKDLDEYEKAYNDIKSNYEGLKYYEQSVIRGDTTVTNTIVINYDKIDIKKLLEIEGAEDNIIEDGKAKVDKWISLAKKFGAVCNDVED